MKLEKRINTDKTVDQWVLYVPHHDAELVYLQMTPLERGMVDQLREHPEQISTVLKVLTLLVTRIEEAQGLVVQADDQREGGSTYDG